MPHYQPGFSGEDYARLKAAVQEVGRSGPFDANDALWHVLQTGISRNVGDVAAILNDMTDLGDLRALGGNPPRWELA